MEQLQGMLQAYEEKLKKKQEVENQLLRWKSIQIKEKKAPTMGKDNMSEVEVKDKEESWLWTRLEYQQLQL